MNKQQNDWSQRLAMSLALLLASAGPVYAVDGVIEINQARALAGGVTDCDTPGFPVSICSPGSYRLTGNLTVAGENDSGVGIFSSNVTLDLNGFAIMGPVTCTATACDPSGGSGNGVYAAEHSVTDSVVVRNGTVQGLGDAGVELRGASSRVERIRAISNGGNGIDLGFTLLGDFGNAVTGCTANRNGGDGILVDEHGFVTGNIAIDNHGNDIGARTGSMVSGNTANLNNQTGINANSGALVSGNTAYGNTSFGLDGGAGYSNNVFVGNNGSNVNDQVGSAVEIGTNQCASDTTCP